MLYRILLKAETPLSFRSGRNTSQSDTLDYIPGSSILGGLANAHQMLGRDKDEFATFFLQERIRFSNGYPSSFQDKNLQGEDNAVMPIPMTARSCKRFPGFHFRADVDRQERKGVTDLLIPLALFAMSGEQRFDLLEHLDECNCKETQKHSLDRIDGFFRRGQEPAHYGKPYPKRAIRTRTGINYDTGTVQSSILYSRQIIDRDKSFWGLWRVDDTLIEFFDTFVQEVEGFGLLRIGSNRTRGFGHVSFNHRIISDESIERIKQRSQSFTEELKKAANETGIEAPAKLYVPILLTSDAILTDPLLRARMRLSSDDLKAVGINSAELIFHAAGVRQVQGWSNLWRMPKADDWAIAMGSVFLFALPEANEDTFAALFRLEQEGIGHRRTEGFGMMEIAHPFHVELAGVYR